MSKRHKPMPTQTFPATITGFSHDGRGIASMNGKITFVRGALNGEEVEVLYRKKHRQFDEAQAVSVIKASPDRVEPICAHYGVCGGCSLQHMQPTAQILAKQQILLDQLRHAGVSEPAEVLAPLTGPTQGYRRKARLGVKYVAAKGKVLVGFREIDGRYLADIITCPVLYPSVGEKLSQISAMIATLAAYQTIPQIEVAVSDNTTALIFRHLQPLSAEDQAQLCAFGAAENIHIYLQPSGINSIHKIWPTDDQQLLSYHLPDQQLELQFHPSDFTQVNTDINRKMINRALELLQPQPHERILDLFCGLGNFTLPLAQQCKEIIGVEGEAGLVQRAANNAQHNQITNAQFFCADLTKDFSQAPWANAYFDKILLDPPRTGALEMVQTIAKFKAKTILYVSCNPATLVRDAKELIAQGYKLMKAGVMDMFPHTSHVESIALFELDTK